MGLVITNHLKEVMDICGVDVNYLVEETGIGKSTLYRYMNKETELTVRNLYNISYALGCDPQDICSYHYRKDKEN